MTCSKLQACGTRAYDGVWGHRSSPSAASRGKAPGQRGGGEKNRNTFSFWTFSGSGKFAHSPPKKKLRSVRIL